MSEVARTYKLPKGTVSNWKNRPAQGVPADGTEKKEEIGRLLLGYLRENLTTLRSQAEFFRTADWLQKQTAADLAVLHGVMADKSVRLLEALGGTGDGATEPQ